MLSFELCLELPAGTEVEVTRSYRSGEMVMDLGGVMIPAEQRFLFPIHVPGVIGQILTGPREWSPAGGWPEKWTFICSVERRDTVSMVTSYGHSWRDRIETGGIIGFIPKPSKFLEKWLKIVMQC